MQIYSYIARGVQWGHSNHLSYSTKKGLSLISFSMFLGVFWRYFWGISWWGGCERFIHLKRGTTATGDLVQIGPVSDLFPVHATGPLNTKNGDKEIWMNVYVLMQNRPMPHVNSVHVVFLEYNDEEKARIQQKHMLIPVVGVPWQNLQGDIHPLSSSGCRHQWHGIEVIFCVPHCKVG